MLRGPISADGWAAAPGSAIGASIRAAARDPAPALGRGAGQRG